MTFSKELVSSDVAEIYEKNFIDVFAILVIQLRLVAEPDRGWRSLVRSTHPFCFETSDAIKEMKNLELFVLLRIVTTTIKYTIRKDLAIALLSKFFTAHMIHDPASRTVSNFKSDSKLQITPKGAALVYEFCKNVGMKEEEMPYVVFSNLNTMQLFHFDRSSAKGKVLHSEYLNHVLITKVMGHKPNVWCPDQNLIPARNLFFEEASYCDNSIESEQVPKGKHVSPIYHRYFSNPQSEAQIQYYESRSGVRLFRNRVFSLNGVSVTVEYCFSGKALVQWLTDCSTLHSASEACEIGQILLDQKLITAVTSTLFSESFYNHADAIYTLTELGGQSCRWWHINPTAEREASESTRAELDNQPSNSEISKIKRFRAVTLDYALSDPGIRYLFRMHLEKERCVENFETYCQLQEFISKKRVCGRMLRHAIREKLAPKRKELRASIESFATSNTLMAFQIYSKYFSLESLYNLNIGFGLQQELDSIIARVETTLVTPLDSANPDISVFARTPELEKCFDVGEPADLVEQQSTSELAVDSSSSAICADIPLKLTISHDSLSDVPSSDLHRADTSSSRTSLDKNLVTLSNIWKVYQKVSIALYRMMESDLFPKFARSQEFLGVMEAITKI